MLLSDGEAGLHGPRLAEVPSNYLLKQFAPSTWIAFLMFSWGIITIGIAGVQSFASVAVTRFLLGLFEAGRCTCVGKFLV